MIKLYGVPASRAMRCLWMLEELGVQYQNEPVHFLGGGTRSPQMLALNPNGHVPVLDDNGFVMYESLAINLYLAQRYAAQHQASLYPSDAHQQALALQWSFWAVTECEKFALDCLMNTIGLPPEQRDVGALDKALAKLARPLAVLDQHLAKQPFILGQDFTIADLNVCGIIYWLKPAKQWQASFAHVSQWLQTCTERDAFKRVRQLQKAAP